MESHILNSYHQARYRIHGHNRMGSTSESYSSESSCTQNSPDYPEKFAPQVSEYQGAEEACDNWEANQNGDTHVTVKAEEESSELSSDEEEIENPETNVVTPHDTEVVEEYYEEEVFDSDDDYEIVVDDDAPHSDGPIIQVYAVDPDLDLEASDEEDYCIQTKSADAADATETVYEEEVTTVVYAENSENGYHNEQENHDNLGINLDTPVVSNVDEYFIKNESRNDEKILEFKDKPVVADVDEYFIKDNNKINNEVQEEEEESTIPNVDDFFVKDVKPNKEIEDLVGNVPNVDDFFNKVEDKPIPVSATKVEDTHVVSTEQDILPHIEHIKRFLLEGMPCPKLQSKSVQRSCSLPHSPAHFSYLDADDAKTSLSFEDLNLDLSDFSFEEGKGEKNFSFSSNNSANKGDDPPRTLTEEDVNSFLIKSKKDIELAFEDPKADVDLNQEDMEIDCPVEAKIDCSKNILAVEPKVNKTVIESIPSTAVANPVVEAIDIESEIKASVIKPIAKPTALEQRKLSKKAIEHVPFTSTPKPKASTLLDFCIEKPAFEKKVIKKEKEIKQEADDFVDVESLNDTVIPVLEANNVSSLLEQFEASEKINPNVRRKQVVKVEPSTKGKVTNGLANGMRLQDAAVQLNKNKMRQILMSSPAGNTVVKKSQTVHSDHDYCSPKKKHSLPASLKGGQSLLKPEVLSSNNKILSSRHRTCKNKKVVYHLSSDDESADGSKNKKESSVKASVKAPLISNHRKKLSPPPSDVIKESNITVISNNASKASDNCSQSSSGSIKLTIKNKSKVILKIDCDDKKDSHKMIKNSEPVKLSVFKQVDFDKKVIQKNTKVDSNVNKIEANSIGDNISTDVVVKEEPHPIKEDFYTALFKNKQDIQITLPEPGIVKCETKPIDNVQKEEITEIVTSTPVTNTETKPQKKKLNLQEYMLRREGAPSNGSSRTVSPEAIFPEMHIPINLDKLLPKSQISPNNLLTTLGKNDMETPKKIFDPIREASRKILANTKNKKAEATRKRDEDIVMSKIPKVENLQLQPLISDAEMMKMVGIVPNEILPIPVTEKEKPKSNKDYVEIVLVSVGTNTDQTVFKKMRRQIQVQNKKREIENERERILKSPTNDKSTINFKIRKSDSVLKQNVFEAIKKDAKTQIEDKREKRQPSPANIKEPKIDKERYKDITATLKSVGKHTKVSSNSLFASIQDVVLKKAPEEEKVVEEKVEKKRDDRRSKPSSPVEKKSLFRSNAVKTKIVRDYDSKVEHGEDKIILHLEKNRSKPAASCMIVQTDPSDEFAQLEMLPEVTVTSHSPTDTNRKRTASDMSLSSEPSPPRRTENKDKKRTEDKQNKTEKQISEERNLKMSMERRSRSKERYESKYRRRSRSSRRSRSRRRRRTRSRTRSRSIDRYRRYRRSDSPYKRSKRSRSRYRRSSTRSRSRRRDYRSNRSRSRSRHTSHRSRSPIAKKTKASPEVDVKTDKKVERSTTPPLRKPTVSESSESSTSSSSSSSSSGSDRSRSRSRSKRRTVSPAYRRAYTAYSEDARDNNTPVEERRIVFVGKLEKDISKAALRSLFSKFGPILEVTLHSKEDGCRYGFVTFRCGRDAWAAVEAGSQLPQYDVGFGGRRAFCRQRYADLDGLEAEYTESAYMGQPALPPVIRNDDMSFEQMLQEMKNKLSQRKNEKKPDDQP